MRLQLWAGAEVHLAGGDRKEALQHGLGLLQVTQDNIVTQNIYSSSNIPAMPPRSILPTVASVCATLGSLSAPSTTRPRAPRKALRLRVSGR